MGNLFKTLMLTLMALTLLLQTGTARAEWTDEAYAEAKAKLEAKIEAVGKEGITEKDVEEITGFLQDKVGDKLEGTGVGELLGAMNTQAKNVTKAKDYADKLGKTIDLIDNVTKAKENNDAAAMVTALADGLDLATNIPGVGPIVKPVLGAYSKAVKGIAKDVGTIQKQGDVTMETIRLTKIGADATPIETDDEEETEPYSSGPQHPYSPNPDKTNQAGWIADNAKVALDKAKWKGVKIDKALEQMKKDKADGKPTAWCDGKIMPIDIAIDKMEVKQGASDEAIKKAQKHYDVLHQGLIDQMQQDSDDNKKAEEKNESIWGDIYNAAANLIAYVSSPSPETKVELPPSAEFALVDAGIVRSDKNGNPVRTNAPNLDLVVARATAIADFSNMHRMRRTAGKKKNPKLPESIEQFLAGAGIITSDADGKPIQTEGSSLESSSPPRLSFAYDSGIGRALAILTGERRRGNQFMINNFYRSLNIPGLGGTLCDDHSAGGGCP